MEMKKCSRCNKKKEISEFSGRSKICKKCASIYYKEYKQKQIDKYGREKYYEMLWERRVRRNAKRNGISQSDFDIDKINKLKWKLGEFPHRYFPNSMTHIEFMKTYNLSVNEYIYIRQKVGKGNYWIN